MEYDNTSFHFKAPCSIILAGPSSCGKTSYTIKVLENSESLFEKPLTRVIIVCSHPQKAYKALQDKFECIFVSSLEEADQCLVPGSVLIVDDQLNSLETPKTSKLLTELFTVRSHHEDLVIFVLLQCLFSKYLRTCFINTTYLLVGKWVKDIYSVEVLARQFQPRKSKQVLECYEDATKLPYQFLLLDFHMLTPNKYRIRSSAFPDEMKIYCLE